MRFLYLIYGLIVLFGTTYYNLGAGDANSGTGSGTSGRGGWSMGSGHK